MSSAFYETTRANLKETLQRFMAFYRWLKTRPCLQDKPMAEQVRVFEKERRGE